MRLRHALAVIGVTTAFLTASAVAAPSARAATGATPVLSRQVIGHSVRNRPIVAYHLGDPASKRTALVLGQMHGDEAAGVTVARALIGGNVAIEGLNLWVIPTMNPDGFAAHTRQNAHHVDLNRNWPHLWRLLSGMYYSGRRPWSEPETRTMRRFLLRVKPQFIVSLHQPLHGVDTTDGGARDHAFRDRLAHNLGLPRKAFRCWSTCHGSMTDWYTVHHYGVAETVEFGGHPAHGYLVGRARRGIIAALGGHFGSLAAHDPHTALHIGLAPARARLTGWAYDIDARGSALRYSVWRDGHRVYSAWASKYDAALNRAHHLRGGHAFDIRVVVTPGRHRLCMVFANVGAGRSRSVHRCSTIQASA